MAHPAANAGRDLARQHRHRKIPRRDRGGDAHGLFDHDQLAAAHVFRNYLAIRSFAFFRKPFHKGRAIRRLAAAFRERLALLERDQSREILLIRHQRGVPGFERDGALLGRTQFPFGEREFRRIHGSPRLGRAAIGDAGQLRSVGGVCDCKAASIGCSDALAPDDRAVDDQVFTLESHVHAFANVTIACASAERPSPTGPTRSAVLNFTETQSSARPSGSRQLFANRQTVILELGSLQNYSGIDVNNRVPLRLGQFLGVAQEHQAVAALPSRIGIGKVHADIAQRGRAEDGVGNGMSEHVGVGVAFQAEFAREWSRRPESADGRARCDEYPSRGRSGS